MTRNMTQGSPMRLIIAFGIPLLFGQVFQQLYSIVDTAIVGKILGGDALAAVGATGPLNTLFIGLGCGTCTGLTIPIAQQMGAGNEKELRRYAANGAFVCGIFSLILMLITIPLCGQLLGLLDTPADIFARSYSYIMVCFIGIPFTMFYNYVAGILNALGDSRTPVIWMSIASIINVALDVVFVLYFHMDVVGAALASQIAQLAALSGCFAKLLRGFPILKMEKADWQWSTAHFLRLCRIGLPMGLQTSMISLGAAIVQTFVNSLGTDCVTVVTASNALFGLLIYIFYAIGNAMSVYGAQNVGAGKLERLHEGIRCGMILGTIWSVIMFFFVYFFCEPACMLFLDEGSRHLLPMCRQFLMAHVWFNVPHVIILVYRMMIQGMGFTGLATFAGILELIGRAAVSALTPVLGFIAVCYAAPISFILADIFLIITYHACYRRLQRTKAQQLTASSC